MDNRIVHARSGSGETEVVRYDRQGRWYLEERQAGIRIRMKTVQMAAEIALDLEDHGGEVLFGQPGGLQFEAKVNGARAKQSRHSK
jgi:hypothetical protein